LIFVPSSACAATAVSAENASAAATFFIKRIVFIPTSATFAYCLSVANCFTASSAFSRPLPEQA
jgi:hypothetical protein